MLTAPALADGEIIESLARDFAIDVVQVEFLPLGADAGTAVYRVSSSIAAYFLKLRSQFKEASVLVPARLRSTGNEAVLAALPTIGGALWFNLRGFTATLYPYVDGQDAIDRPLTDEQWREFGAALRAIHAAPIAEQIRREAYADDARHAVRRVLRNPHVLSVDPIAARLAAALRQHQSQVELAVGMAERLAATSRDRSPGLVLCHADIHAANLIVGDDGSLHIVDWDEVTAAPKERDLMFIGGGVCGWASRREINLFYRGYGAVDVDVDLLAYYRFERIVQDIAATCAAVSVADHDPADRQRDIGFFTMQFEPGGVFDIACATAAARGSTASLLD